MTSRKLFLWHITIGVVVISAHIFSKPWRWMKHFTFLCRRKFHFGQVKSLIVTMKNIQFNHPFFIGYPIPGFLNINKKEKYLVTGTPCQIDSFRRFIQKFHCEDNFLLLDFFCHGVPSMLLWKIYLENCQKKVGKITYVSWRNKFKYGWHDSWLMGIDGENTSKKLIGKLMIALFFSVYWERLLNLGIVNNKYL